MKPVPKKDKNITVIVNHSTNTVVWASEGHGKTMLEQFYHCLNPEQLASIKVVTEDDAMDYRMCQSVYSRM